LINLRIRALKSKQCSVKENDYVCPEVFLDAVSEKLASMAVLFLNVELLSEFYYQVTIILKLYWRQFPRELDNRLLHSLSSEEVNRLAKEDPKIRDHIELMERKSVLEYALQKIEDLKSLEASKEETVELVRKPRRFF
jgi:dynamin-like GTPase MGM1, mitochondrial